MGFGLLLESDENILKYMSIIRSDPAPLYFGLKHIGSVSFITHQIRKEKQENQQFDKTVGLVIDYII